MCEMSRQASNTESTENPEVSHSVLDELVKMSNNDDNISEMSEDTLARSNSDSTERTNSEADQSESSSSQTDHESRKGSDVSETESAVFSPLSQKKPPFPATTQDAHKPNIPLSFDANISETTPGDAVKHSCETDSNKEGLNVPIFHDVKDTEHKVISQTSDNLNTCICYNDNAFISEGSKNEHSNTSDLETSQEISIDINTDNVAHDISRQGISHFDQTMPFEGENDQYTSLSGSSMNDAKDMWLKQSICSQSDSYVVIDDNSNIHDIKESSTDCNYDNVIHSTHL